MVSDPNSFGNPEFLKDLEFINDQLSKTKLGQPPAESQTTSDAAQMMDVPAAPTEKEALNQELEEACLNTGATGAAIALVQGEEMVCHASAGPQAPGIGSRLDLRTGLSGSCIQTRLLQQCIDTETDSRVDAGACRRLGVRSVVALPLLDGDKVFGIFEILSSRPNAFSQRDLESLQALADRIVERKKQNREASAPVSSAELEVFRHKLEEVVPRDKSNSAESAFEVPRPKRTSKRNDRSTSVLGVLVVASAMLLGMLVGWRLGWEKATLGFRASAPFHRTNARPNHRQTDHAAFPTKPPQPSSTGTEECGHPGAADSETQSGGLTICQGGRVLFRSPASPVPPIRNLQASQASPGLKANTAPR
jgi:putative methionine-R-sulfoxide reductase with GAF domain